MAVYPKRIAALGWGVIADLLSVATFGLISASEESGDTYTKDFTIDGIVKEILSKTFTIDGVVATRNTETITVDGIVAERKTATFTLDGIIVISAEANTKDFTIDGIIKEIKTSTFTIDANVVDRLTKTFTIDGYVRDTKTEDFTIDGQVVERKTEEFTLDAIVKEINAEAFSIDAIVKEILTETFTIDGYIAERKTKEFTVDGIIAERTIKTLTADGYVLEEQQKTFTTDGRIRDISSILLGADGYIKETKQLPTIKRIEKGLLLYDDFSTDTSANYQGYGTTIGWSNGHLTLVAVANPYVVMHKTATNAMCLTMHGQTGGGYFAGPLLAVYSTYDPVENRDSYYYREYGTQMRLYRYANMGATLLAEKTAQQSADPWWSRIYKNDNVLSCSGGGNALIDTLSIELTEPIYSGPFYTGARCNTNRWIDRWEARTSHLITVTNLPSGYYVIASDGTITASAIEVGGTATIDAGAVLFPLATLSVYDENNSLVIQLTSSDYSDMGGGDTYEFTPRILTADGFIRDTFETSITVDGNLADRIIEEFTTDGYVLAETTKLFTVDGRIKEVKTKTITVDSIIRFDKILSLGEVEWVELLGKASLEEIFGSAEWEELNGKAEFE